MVQFVRVDFGDDGVGVDFDGLRLVCFDSSFSSLLLVKKKSCYCCFVRTGPYDVLMYCGHQPDDDEKQLRMGRARVHVLAFSLCLVPALFDISETTAILATWQVIMTIAHNLFIHATVRPSLTMVMMNDMMTMTHTLMLYILRPATAALHFSSLPNNKTSNR